MPVSKSLKAFQEEKLNCAQSILRGFQDKHQVSEKQIIEAKKNGGGRVENGICGALHAALQLTKDETARKQLNEAFIAHAGAVDCKTIRANGKLSCAGCVELAAKTIHKAN